jgi:hypothetical protein
MGLEIKWSNCLNLKINLKILDIEHVIKRDYVCLFWFVGMIERMKKSIVAIEVMDNDD